MEKNLPFEIIEVDLRNKPDWYFDLNPAGAVPTLRHGDFVLQESLIINEYINELSDQPHLLPIKPRQRAEARFWIEFFSSRVGPLFYRLLRATEGAEQSTITEKMHEALKQLDTALQNRPETGPYWFGQQIGLTDIACYPWFERWPVLQHYREMTLPVELKSLHKWMTAMQSRQSVQLGAQPEKYYIEEYADYASGKK
jgi:glutathione S-transferase